MKDTTVSIIIPVYNEAHNINKCLESLQEQTIESEIVVIDDGSTDASIEIVKNFKSKIPHLSAYSQSHTGPGAARNLGVKHAKGEILVFVDADMTFAPDFLQNLVQPIETGKTRGTFTKTEYVSNWKNVWARCWNYNLGLHDSRRLPKEYPETAPVFRAILKSEFARVGGFTPGIGWTDDWTLSRKLGYQATTTSATCFHANPDNLSDVWRQARWIGKNEFFTNGVLRMLWQAFRHSFPVSIVVGIVKSIRYLTLQFFLFKIVYDLAVSVSVLESPGSQERNK